MSEDRSVPQEELASVESTPEADPQQPSSPTPAAESEEGPSTGAAEAPPPSPEKRTPWWEHRISNLTARLREAERQNERLKTPAETQPQEPPATASRNEAAFADVERRAAEIAAMNAFNEKCNETAQQGRKDFPDFDSRLGELLKLVDREDPRQVGAYNQFLQAAIETGEGARVIRELGGNLDEAARVMALPPVRMAVELTKMAVRQPEPVSQAPKPITPIQSNGRSVAAGIAPDDPERADQLSTAEWMRRREAQAVERRR